VGNLIRQPGAAPIELRDEVRERVAALLQID
jgi:hypothetical protein